MNRSTLCCAVAIPLRLFKDWCASNMSIMNKREESVSACININNINISFNCVCWFITYVYMNLY